MDDRIVIEEVGLKHVVHSSSGLSIQTLDISVAGGVVLKDASKVVWKLRHMLGVSTLDGQSKNKAEFCAHIFLALDCELAFKLSKDGVADS